MCPSPAVSCLLESSSSGSAGGTCAAEKLSGFKDFFAGGPGQFQRPSVACSRWQCFQRWLVHDLLFSLCWRLSEFSCACAHAEQTPSHRCCVCVRCYYNYHNKITISHIVLLCTTTTTTATATTTTRLLATTSHALASLSHAVRPRDAAFFRFGCRRKATFTATFGRNLWLCVACRPLRILKCIDEFV